MQVFDDTAGDVLRLIEMVLHRSTGTLTTSPTALVVDTYLAVSTRLRARADEIPDRTWVLSTAHSLARRAVEGELRPLRSGGIGPMAGDGAVGWSAGCSAG